MDSLVRAIAADGNVRAFAAVTTGVVEEARKRHHTFPTATAALGRTLTAAAMMGANLKSDERILIQIIGDGPVRQIVAESDSVGNVRGYVHNPLVHFPLNNDGKLDVARAVGKGTLFVTRDMGLKEPYRGSVPLISGELGEDFAYYFVRSEQTPSAVSLGVLVETDNSVRAAGGMIIQLMPKTSSDVAESLEQRILHMPAPSKMVDLGKSPKEILHMVLGDMDLKILEERPVQFKCKCNRDRMESSLIALGPDELRDMIESQRGAELICHFCNEKYWFSELDLKRLILQARKSGNVGDGTAGTGNGRNKERSDRKE